MTDNVKIGDRVRLTPDQAKNLDRGLDETGTVVGRLESSNYFTVYWDSGDDIESWHVSGLIKQEESPSTPSLKDDIKATIAELNGHLDTLKKYASGSNIPVQHLRKPDGTFVMVELLTAKAQLYYALVTLKDIDVRKM
jgi:hypothetical protein